MKSIAVIAVLLVLSATASGSSAEVFTLDLGTVPTREVVSFDFGIPLVDVTAVAVVFSGQGGHQCIHINRPGQNESIDFPFVVTVTIEGGTADYLAPLDEAYDTTLEPHLSLGETWDSLTDGTGSVEFRPRHSGPEINDFQTTACGFDPFTVTAATIIVATENSVPTDRRTWSTFKAVYR